ncbi:MAG: ribonuclease HI family protein [Candidatus Curtissbacteria bacterium]
MIEISTDGGSRGNPGQAAYGFVVKVDGQLVKEGRGCLGIATNNFAEYTAVIRALEFAKDNFKGKDLKFYMDSNLVVSQLSGLFKIRSASIRELVFRVRSLESEFGQITYTHIPREKNKEADRQVNLALDQDLWN